ncbi:MAG: hypothetical protein K0Q72_99 [Armatimonadetes bacterium]|jgi:hypothetical protein|nr:hypothetical protein [Armatimonadota bacterium]
MAETLYASFASPADAERAVGALLDHGIKDEDISLVAHESYGQPVSRTVDELDEDDTVEHDDPVAAAKHGISTTTAADAGSGAITGAGVGLGVGAIAAIASLFLPGIGLITGGGALAAALVGAAATTAAGGVVGGVTGYLKDQGVPDFHAERYDETVRGGGAVIGIRVPSNNVDRAEIEDLLGKYNAHDLGHYGMTV